jgi:hypothetical protein
MKAIALVSRAPRVHAHAHVTLGTGVVSRASAGTSSRGVFRVIACGNALALRIGR